MTVELARSDLYEVSQWSNTSSHVMGVEPNYTVVRFIPMATGRFLDDADLAQRPPRGGAGLEGGQSSLHRPAHAGRDHHHQRNGFYRDRIGGEDQPRQQRLTTTRRVYIPVTTMQELFPLKGDNIPQDALTSIQYQPTTKGDDHGGGGRGASGDRRSGTASTPR